MYPSGVITLFRTVVGDDDATTYTDGQLSKILTSSSWFVQSDVKLNTTYTIDIGAQTISPDPTLEPDTDFITLVIFKGACVLMRAEQRKKGGNGIVIKDGPNTFDLSKQADGYKNAADDFCKQYEDAKLQYAGGNTVGHLITTPYRTCYDGQYPAGWFYGRRGGY